MKIMILYSNDKIPVSYTGINNVIIYQDRELMIMEIKHEGRHITSLNIARTDTIRLSEEEKQ